MDGDRERIPYEADALINQLSHYCVDREYTMARRSHEYLLGNATWPTEWILQSVLIAWYDYLYTGDLRAVKTHYETLKNKTLTALSGTDGFVSLTPEKLTPELYASINLRGQTLKNIVDWPHTGILGLGKAEGGETDGFVFRDVNTVVNAYHYCALELMARMAGAAGESEDSAAYARRPAVWRTISTNNCSIKKPALTATASAPTTARCTPTCSRSASDSPTQNGRRPLRISLRRGAWPAASTARNS